MLKIAFIVLFDFIKNTIPINRENRVQEKGEKFCATQFVLERKCRSKELLQKASIRRVKIEKESIEKAFGMFYL